MFVILEIIIITIREHFTFLIFEILSKMHLIPSNCSIFSDIEAVLLTTMLNSKMDPRVVAACDADAFPAILDRHGDMTWLKKAESYISSILMKDNPTDEEKKDLKVLHENGY